MEFDFSEIRPYRTQEEIVDAREKLLQDPMFCGFAKRMFKEETKKLIFEVLPKVNAVADFQKNISMELLQNLEKQTTSGVTVSGLDSLDREKNYLFISNHRDIIMDSAMLCYVLQQDDRDTVEIAIGSNLLIYPWIERLVKLNKSFVVKRGVSGKEQLLNAKELSAYILDTLTNRKQSIWLAQKEGRGKDGIDKTQLSVLKMLNYAGKGGVLENMKALNIVPMAISYEYEPCDYLKAKELYMSQNGSYQKTPKDDLQSMFMGLKMNKGHIHIALGKPIDSIECAESLTSNEQLECVVNKIDEQITSIYRLYSTNYIALDLLRGTDEYLGKHYTEEEKDRFIIRMELLLQDIQEDADIHKKIFLEIYANPLLQQLKL